MSSSKWDLNIPCWRRCFMFSGTRYFATRRRDRDWTVWTTWSTPPWCPGGVSTPTSPSLWAETLLPSPTINHSVSHCSSLTRPRWKRREEIRQNLLRTILERLQNDAIQDSSLSLTLAAFATFHIFLFCVFFWNGNIPQSCIMSTYQHDLQDRALQKQTNKQKTEGSLSPPLFNHHFSLFL